jgi:hypothetical protein
MKFVGIPDAVVAEMKASPAWAGMEAMAVAAGSRGMLPRSPWPAYSCAQSYELAWSVGSPPPL